MDTYEVGTAGVGHLWLGHLDTYGMDTYEVDTDGLRHLWLEHLGEDSYGLDTYGMDTLDVDTDGLGHLWLICRISCTHQIDSCHYYYFK